MPAPELVPSGSFHCVHFGSFFGLISAFFKDAAPLKVDICDDHQQTSIL